MYFKLAYNVLIMITVLDSYKHCKMPLASSMNTYLSPNQILGSKDLTETINTTYDVF